ncbi:hypothetical protein BH11PAT1_BH11PAT1_3740 [soil metagenome]
MAKIFSGIITSVAMEKTILVEVTRHVPHPLYRKLMKRSKKHKVDNSEGIEVKVGQTVKIVAVKPISKDKHFKLLMAMDTKVASSSEDRQEPEVEKTIEVKPKKAVKKGAGK